MNETESSVWLAHFRAELLVHCVKLGFYFDNSANTLAGHDFYSGLVLPFYRMFYSERMVVLLGVFMRLFNLILRIKIAATYSRVVGKDLGFIGTERMTDAVVHDFTVSTVRGTTIERVKLKFTQYSQGGLVIGVKFHKSSNYKSLKYSFSYVEFSNPRFNQLLS